MDDKLNLIDHNVKIQKLIDTIVGQTVTVDNDPDELYDDGKVLNRQKIEAPRNFYKIFIN